MTRTLTVTKRFAPNLLTAAALTMAMHATLADPIPAGWQASGLTPIGYTDLNGHRAGIKLAIRKAGDRWFLYKASGNGLDIVDVTDPTDPKPVKFIDGPKGTYAGQVTLSGDLLLLGLSRPITVEEFSGRADGFTIVQKATSGPQPFEEAVLLYDISDPADPKLQGKWSSHAQGSHRNGYPGGKYAFMSVTMPGFRGFNLVVLDVSDPKKPKQVAHWTPPGSKAGETPRDNVNPSFHGPAFMNPDGRTMTVGYTPSVFNLDVSDMRKPRIIGEVRLIPPFVNTGTQSIHTAIPLWDRKLIYFSGEPMKGGCNEPQTPIGFIDNADPKHPFLKSLFPTPIPPAGAAYKSFCDKGGRFGPHNTVTEIYSPDVMPPKDTMYVAWFTAGLRAFDISDARDVKEVGWFLPPDPPTPITSQAGTLRANATQDVLQDSRGNIYIIDSAWGIWVLRDDIGKRIP